MPACIQERGGLHMQKQGEMSAAPSQALGVGIRMGRRYEGAVCDLK